MYPKFPENLYQNYKDKLNDWRNILDDIYYISTYKFKDESVIEEYKEILLSEECFNYYLKLEKSLILICFFNLS